MNNKDFNSGDIIFFDLETWPDDEMIMVEYSAKVLRICHDPLGRHESKCIVDVNGVGYGIPFSRIKKVIPKNNKQLELF
jgi:hypothetical protein